MCHAVFVVPREWSPMRYHVVLTALVQAFLSACGGGGGTTPPPAGSVYSSLSVNPSTAALVDGDTVQLVATPRDQNGAPMSGLPSATFIRESGTSVSVSGSGQVIAQSAGASSVRASLTSGTTTHTAAATVDVTALALAAAVTASGGGSTFTPDLVKIAVNGEVTWSFPGPTAHNVTFTSPPSPVSDIDTRSTGSVARTFTVAGRHNYRCTIHPGMEGAVIVRTP
jgi:plastocyanin